MVRVFDDWRNQYARVEDAASPTRLCACGKPVYTKKARFCWACADDRARASSRASAKKRPKRQRVAKKKVTDADIARMIADGKL